MISRALSTQELPITLNFHSTMVITGHKDLVAKPEKTGESFLTSQRTISYMKARVLPLMV